MSVTDVEPNRCHFECPECLLKYSAVPSVAHADWDACPRCEDSKTLCPACAGSGEVYTNWRPPPNEPAHYEKAICPDCDGSGRIPKRSE